MLGRGRRTGQDGEEAAAAARRLLLLQRRPETGCRREVLPGGFMAHSFPLGWAAGGLGGGGGREGGTLTGAPASPGLWREKREGEKGRTRPRCPPPPPLLRRRLRGAEARAALLLLLLPSCCGEVMRTGGGARRDSAASSTGLCCCCCRYDGGDVYLPTRLAHSAVNGRSPQPLRETGGKEGGAHACTLPRASACAPRPSPSIGGVLANAVHLSRPRVLRGG